MTNDIGKPALEAPSVVPGTAHHRKTRGLHSLPAAWGQREHSDIFMQRPIKCYLKNWLCAGEIRAENICLFSMLALFLLAGWVRGTAREEETGIGWSDITFHHSNVIFDWSIYLINQPGTQEAYTIYQASGNTEF